MLKRFVILSDNYAHEQFNCIAEHGSSIYIETTEGRFLLDTGRGDAVLRNAQHLSVDLRSLDAVIISHGHYDHIGGLKQILGFVGRQLTVYAHPDVFSERWLRKDNTDVMIGAPDDLCCLQSLGANFVFTYNSTQISTDLYVTGTISRPDNYASDAWLVIKSENGFVTDPIYDDQAVFVLGDDGISVFLGCTHSGIGNTLDHICRLTNQSAIRRIVGGLHLFRSNDNEIIKVINQLNARGVQEIIASHCTGFDAIRLLTERFEGEFHIGGVGLEIRTG